MKSWTLKEALVWVAILQEHVRPCGYHIGLHGSVLHKGKSSKDLDLIVYPHNSGAIPTGLIAGAIERAGLTYRRERALYQDEKEIRIYTIADGRRIDIFFLQ
jgi:hypothetical protein